MKNRKLLSDHGLTMMELIITVVIIGVLAALAAPSFDRGIQRIKFRGESKDIVSLLRTARSEAITQKDPYGVYFDNSARIIKMFKDKVNLSSYIFEDGSDSVVSVDTLPAEFVYLYASFANSAVVFQPNGAGSGSGDIYLMSDCRGIINFSQINVLASTGKTKLLAIHNY